MLIFLDRFFRAFNRFSYFIHRRTFGERIDTTPLLSSDCYALSCDISFNRNDDRDEMKVRIQQIGEHHSIFVSGSLVDFVSGELKKHNLNVRKFVIGDDDLTQDGKSLLALTRYTREIFSVNLIHPSKNVNALPLGLESPSYRSAGRVKDFSTVPLTSSQKRPLSFLVAWNTETNLASRSMAREHFSNATGALVFNRRIAPQTFHRLLRLSLFTPCPAGNGLDTHRIWEAMYLGSIPLVLEAEYFPALDGWPVILVKTWEDMTQMSRSQLEVIYDKNVWPHCKVMEKNLSILEMIAR